MGGERIWVNERLSAAGGKTRKKRNSSNRVCFEDIEMIEIFPEREREPNIIPACSSSEKGQINYCLKHDLFNKDPAAANVEVHVQ